MLYFIIIFSVTAFDSAGFTLEVAAKKVKERSVKGVGSI